MLNSFVDDQLPMNFNICAFCKEIPIIPHQGRCLLHVYCYYCASVAISNDSNTKCPSCEVVIGDNLKQLPSQKHWELNLLKSCLISTNQILIFFYLKQNFDKNSLNKFNNYLKSWNYSSWCLFWLFHKCWYVEPSSWTSCWCVPSSAMLPWLTNIWKPFYYFFTFSPYQEQGFYHNASQ